MRMTANLATEPSDATRQRREEFSAARRRKKAQKEEGIRKAGITGRHGFRSLIPEIPAFLIYLHSSFFAPSAPFCG